MSMEPFFSLCPQVAVSETRTITVWGNRQLPEGEYGFIELYCVDLECDCRRVLIQVMTPTSGAKVWATINYGWESLEYYKEWSHGVDDDCRGPLLDPVNPQSPYAKTLLEFFKEMLKDRTYADRFAKHYILFRKALKHRK